MRPATGKSHHKSSGARRIAVLSATKDSTYGFFAPLTALVWRRVAGFEPLLLLVGDEAEWRGDPQAAVALDEAARCAEIVFVPRPANAADHTLAQVMRLCAAALDGGDDDYLVVSDIDLWPVSPKRFRAWPIKQTFQVFNADAYGPDGERFPICHLAGRRAVWREIFPLDGGLAGALQRVPWPSDGDWHFDEKHATARLLAWHDFAAHGRRIARPPGPNHGRIDRSDWQFDDATSLDGVVDAHLLRPGSSPENWPRLRALLARLVGSDDLAAADAYQARYVTAHPTGTAPRASVPRAAAPDDLEAWYALWFQEVARLAPEPYRSYGGYGDGLPNGTACSLESIRVFASLVDDPSATILNAGAGASSFLLRRMFPRVVCVDGDPGYMEVVRRICVAHGLSGDGFVAGMENAPDADFTYYDYGEITATGRLAHHRAAYRKTRRAVYFDDADDRPHGFPRFRQLVLDFAASQGLTAEDRRDARDHYGRWGVVVRKPPPRPAGGLIAFSLWGRDRLYVEGALANLEAAGACYPGYRVRIYTDDPPALDEAARIAGAARGALVTGVDAFAARAGVSLEVVAMPPNRGVRGMFWRFLAASDQMADPILFRDCDSRLNPREAAAVLAWLESGRKFHVMRDHVDHASWPMLGGMWGVRGGAVPDMDVRVGDWSAANEKLDDMRFLAERVWPEARRDLMHHSSVVTPIAPALPFPPHLSWRGFVGEIVSP